MPPPRYKMLIVTCIAAFPTLNVVNFLLQPLKPLPLLLRTLIATVVLLTLMTYVIMPRMTKLFAGWLYPKSRKSGLGNGYNWHQESKLHPLSLPS